ncbi:hypothetical protein [Acinetobacter sp. ANC 5054]|uniref:hypothetical protein n=1 Tax=Acinetobacter sp. ANC 5054 TaxID=1977877 RepID=UPI000A32EC06|nr:hypothetical protein [Acinetobacter sp. ANC 5054]
MKNSLKATLCLSLTLAAPSLWADTNTAQQNAETPAKPLVAPYGDNPNLLHVWAYKTQEGVVGAAKNLGELAERGVSKIKPSVDQAWDNTKSMTNNTVQQVDQGAQQVTQNVNEKLKDTRERITGKSSNPAPITQQSLSEPSSGNQYNPAPSQNSGQNSNQYPQSTNPSSSGSTTYPVTDL